MLVIHFRTNNPIGQGVSISTVFFAAQTIICRGWASPSSVLQVLDGRTDTPCRLFDTLAGLIQLGQIDGWTEGDRGLASFYEDFQHLLAALVPIEIRGIDRGTALERQ